MTEKLRAVIRWATPGTLAMVLLAAPTFMKAAELSQFERQVRHELVMLPYYSVFDHLEFQVSGAKVTLTGQVTRPTLKKGAERVVERIEQVSSVDNQIEVLPVSPNDDRIREGVFRALYYHPNLTRYGFQAVPPIHIVVKNGDVNLVRVVTTKSEKNVAGIQANGVSGVSSVTNNLRIEGR